METGHVIIGIMIVLVSVIGYYIMQLKGNVVEVDKMPNIDDSEEPVDDDSEDQSDRPCAEEKKVTEQMLIKGFIDEKRMEIKFIQARVPHGFKNQQKYIRDVVFHSKYVAACCVCDHNVYLMTTRGLLEKNQLIYKHEIKRSSFPTGLAINGSGTRLAVAIDCIHSGYIIRMFQLVNEKITPISKDDPYDEARTKHKSEISELRWLSEKNYLISAIHDTDSCHIYNATTGDHIYNIHTSQLKNAMFTCSEKYLVCASFMAGLKVYKFRDENNSSESGESIVYKYLELVGHKSSVQYVSINPQKNQLVSISNDKTMKVWTLEKLDYRAKPSEYILNNVQLDSIVKLGYLSNEELMIVEFSPTGNLIALVVHCVIHVLDAKTLEEKFKICTKGNRIHHFKWSPNGKSICVSLANSLVFFKIMEA